MVLYNFKLTQLYKYVFNYNKRLEINNLLFFVLFIQIILFSQFHSIANYLFPCDVVIFIRNLS